MMGDRTKLEIRVERIAGITTRRVTCDRVEPGSKRRKSKWDT